MDPERQIELKNQYGIVLEEYVSERRLDVSPEVPPAQEEPPAQKRDRRRILWHFKAIGLASRKRPAGVGTGKGVTVAVIDSGVDTAHPELHSQVLQSLNFVPSESRRQPTGPHDVLGHGTYVSGLIAGRTIGIAPAAKLINLQVLDEKGSTTDSTLLSALEWVAGQRSIRLVVLCLGSLQSRDIDHPSGIYQTVIERLMAVGILPVIAVGNEGVGNAISPGDCFGAISVGGMNKNGRVADFSGSGGRVYNGIRYSVPSLVAPGEDVFSTLPGEESYTILTGTTPATAIVTGVAALLAEQHPDLDAWQLREQLQTQCRRLPNDPEDRQGAGLVQVKGKDAA